MACWKKQYQSWQHAANDLRDMRRKAERGRGMEVYRCKECNAFHVGHIMGIETRRSVRKRYDRKKGI